MFNVSQPRSGGRVGGLGTVLVLGVVAAVVVAGLWVVGRQLGWFAPQEQTSRADTRQEQPQGRRAGLEEVLSARAEAMRTKDRAGWLAVLDPADATLQQAQSAVFDNMQDVAFDLVEYEYTGEGELTEERQTALGPQAWVAKVNISYRIADVDLGSVRREQYVTMVQREREWFIAGFTDHPDDLQPVQDLWELGPVTVTRGERSLVLSGTGAQQEELAAQVDRGARAVDEVWGVGWPRTVVIVQPAGSEQMPPLLGRTDSAGLDQIAAVTTGEVGLTYTGVGADRIIINPSGYGRLDGAAAEMVMAHEITHVAARSGGGGEVPIWFSEGMADYVAFKNTDLSTWQRAGDVLTLVREGRMPTRLPDRDAFDPALTDVAPAYAGSYLAVQLLADRYGEDKVLALYRTVQGTDTRDGATEPAVPMDTAMRQLLGVSEAEFVEQWQEHLARTAG